MYKEEDNSAYDEFQKEGTGSREVTKEYKEIVYPFGKYQITVRLSPGNEFIGISEVKVNRDFLSYKQKMISKGFHDVEEFYRE